MDELTQLTERFIVAILVLLTVALCVGFYQALPPAPSVVLEEPCR